MTLQYRQVFLGKGPQLGIQARLRLTLERGNSHHVIRRLFLNKRHRMSARSWPEAL